MSKLISFIMPKKKKNKKKIKAIATCMTVYRHGCKLPTRLVCGGIWSQVVILVFCICSTCVFLWLLLCDSSVSGIWRLKCSYCTPRFLTFSVSYGAVSSLMLCFNMSSHVITTYFTCSLDSRLDRKYKLFTWCIKIYLLCTLFFFVYSYQ